MQNNHPVGDEEFAEKLYDREAEVPPKFDEPHAVSYTGGQLHPPSTVDPQERAQLLGTDVPPPEQAG